MSHLKKTSVGIAKDEIKKKVITATNVSLKTKEKGLNIIIEFVLGFVFGIVFMCIFNFVLMLNMLGIKPLGFIDLTFILGVTKFWDNKFPIKKQENEPKK